MFAHTFYDTFLNDDEYKIKIKLVHIGDPAYYGDKWVNVC